MKTIYPNSNPRLVPPAPTVKFVLERKHFHCAFFQGEKKLQSKWLPLQGSQKVSSFSTGW